MTRKVDVDPRSPYDNVERLATVEMRAHNMLQGYIPRLYAIVRGENPITYDISREFLGMRNARVAIVTGIVVEKLLPKGEVDGPVGAAVLGRALSRLGHDVDILVEKEMDDVVASLIETLGFEGSIVHTTDRSPEDLARWADDYDVAVTIEKLGRNREGVRHSVMGSPLAKSGDYYIDDFIEAMNEKGKLTVGIGDGGNEIGFGKIYDHVRGMVAFGADCGCPCGGGTATTTATGYLFPAAISNYGAYALTTALALGASDGDLLVDGETVRELVEACVSRGCLDGGTVKPDFIGDDGVPIDAVMRYVDQLGSIFAQWMSTFDRDF
ncbi:MAG: DUF4392 domain-containing protein [Immundisolibacterales bacterium]|nr:DUF4392 domain-containing protein [Immundisolibacterales bacterium]